jgi:hypothetical protein
MYSALNFSLPPPNIVLLREPFDIYSKMLALAAKKYVFKKSKELNINESVYTHQRIPRNPSKNPVVPHQKILLEYNKITQDSTGQTLPGTIFGNFL